jgi:hypothetical protein
MAASLNSNNSQKYLFIVCELSTNFSSFAPITRKSTHDSHYNNNYWHDRANKVECKPYEGVSRVTDKVKLDFPYIGGRALREPLPTLVEKNEETCWQYVSVKAKSLDNHPIAKALSGDNHIEFCFTFFDLLWKKFLVVKESPLSLENCRLINKNREDFTELAEVSKAILFLFFFLVHRLCCLRFVDFFLE